MIEAGSSLPAIDVKLIKEGDIVDVSSTEIFSKGTIVAFTVPGAFTPTCHNEHLPGYIILANELRAAGADRIICLTANDKYVVSTWAATIPSAAGIEFIADGNAELAKAMGLDVDLSAGGLGVRFIRAAFISDNGKIRAIFTEDSPGVVTSSGAPAMLEVLKG